MRRSSIPFNGGVDAVIQLLAMLALTSAAAEPTWSVRFEAESGMLGSAFAVSNAGSPAYISVVADSSGSNPGSAARVASYTVALPRAGSYQLYARVRVGAGGYNDDSLFYGNGFGARNSTNSSDWILVNGLAGVGVTEPDSVVTGAGSAGIGVWKWINLSQFAPGATFKAAEGNLVQTFQIGSRENGLDIDAFVFGINGMTYTVANLDAGADGTPPAGGVSTVDGSSVLQGIDGFGAGAVFLDSGLDPISSANMDMLYGTNAATQLGLTILRVRIDPSTNWTSALTDAQKAVARGARVFATPWTPPASMKTNNSLIGGSLSADQYDHYASYLNRFAGYMKSNGVSLAAVSIQNEPDFLATYESCIWSASQFLSFFRTNAAKITNAPLMMPESYYFAQSLSDPTLNDAMAAANVSLIGGHLYGAAISDYPNAHQKGKPTWMTEYLVNDQSIDSAMATAQQIHQCLTVGNMSAYVWWKTLGDSNGLVSAAGAPQKRGFALAQFSRFVRPGFNRVSATNTGGVLVTAYRNTNDQSFVVVAVNPTAFVLTSTFALQNLDGVASVTPWITSPDLSLAAQSSVPLAGASFTYALPALSVVTFVGQTNHSPALAAMADQTINAGVTLRVTNLASDPELPAQSLTFSLLKAPANSALMTINASNAVFVWRPAVSQAGTTNLITFRVADNGSPSRSATNSMTVTVNPLSSRPVIRSLASRPGEPLSMAIEGPLGPDYTVLTASNLSDWQALWTSNSPALPFTLTLTNSSEPARFYRILIGP